MMQSMVMPVDRARLRQLIGSPTISPELAARLAALPVDLLVEAVLDPKEPWWRQRPCALALAGRVPARHAEALFAFVGDTNRITEVRAAVLAALSVPDGPVGAPLLAWLHAQDGVEQKYGFDLALLRARAALGDITAAPQFVTLAADAWTHRRTLGEQLMDAAVARSDLRAVSIRPSWVQWEGNYERSLGPWLRDQLVLGHPAGAICDGHDRTEITELGIPSLSEQ